MSKERYLEQEINKDLRILELERQLEEANDKNTWIKKQQESWNSTTKETIKDLERQLAEAREKIDIQKGHLELAISLSDDLNIKLLCTALLEQLKEQG